MLPFIMRGDTMVEYYLKLDRPQIEKGVNIEKYNFIRGSTYTYFVQAKDGGPVKIGMTNDYEDRLKGLQSGYPYKLVIRKLFINAGWLERELHKNFSRQRLRGEWFEENVLSKANRFLYQRFRVLAPNVLQETDNLSYDLTAVLVPINFTRRSNKLKLRKYQGLDIVRASEKLSKMRGEKLSKMRVA